MIHSNLRVEVQGPYILVAMRGTCLRAKYRKQDAPWLAPEEYGEDPEATITSRGAVRGKKASSAKRDLR